MITKEMSEKEFQLFRLRRMRQKYCFSVINRGQLWYDTLTAEQKVELKAWYAAWLDVTKTLVEPATPAWL